jgi:hypothetical protein
LSRAFRLALDRLEQGKIERSHSFLLASMLRARVLRTVSERSADSDNLVVQTIGFGLAWLDCYSSEAEAPYIADRLLRLPEVADRDWTRVASGALIRLQQQPLAKDVDYTLLSINRRPHLLSDFDKAIFIAVLRTWLRTTKDLVGQLISRRKFLMAAKALAPALPLATWLEDAELMEELEARARKLRDVDAGARAEFDRATWSLFKVRAWRSRAEARASFRRMGLVTQQAQYIGKLKWLATSGKDEPEASLLETLEGALEAAHAALEEQNFKLVGYLAAKMLPVAARAPGPHLVDTVVLVRRLLPLVPAAQSCGFRLECDEWIIQDLWPSRELAFLSLERAGVDTPVTLAHSLQAESSAGRQQVERALDFVEQLLVSLPVRAGLFLAPLLVLTARLSDAILTLRCVRLVRGFLASGQVSEKIKVEFSVRVLRLVGPSDQDEMRSIVDVLGLQGPWLAKQARADILVGREDLCSQLERARALVNEGYLLRAGTLLAPILVLSARCGDAELLEEVCAESARLLAHARLTHEERDAFTRACKSLPWPDPNLEEEVFETLGIGAPCLDRLLIEAVPAVSVEQLRRSLEHAEDHMRAERLGGVYHILQPALPLASWVDDESLLTALLGLAERFLIHPRTSQRFREHFLSKCLQHFHEGRWRSVEVARASMARMGLQADPIRDERGTPWAATS